MLARIGRIVALCGVAGFLLGASVEAAQDPHGVETKTGPAHVVVYRPTHRDPKMIKPSVYCDGKEVALMYSGRFFTIALSPGKHTIASSNEQTSVSLDAKSGVTYYVRVFAVGKWVRNQFSVEQVDASTALNGIASLKPADDSHVMAPEIVSIGAIPGK
jgi:hypothetical protein